MARNIMHEKNPNEKATKCNRRKTLVAVWRLVWQALIKRCSRWLYGNSCCKSRCKLFRYPWCCFAHLFVCTLVPHASMTGTCARSSRWWLWECNFAYSKSSQDLRKDHRLVYVVLVRMVGIHLYVVIFCLPIVECRWGDVPPFRCCKSRDYSKCYN